MPNATPTNGKRARLSNAARLTALESVAVRRQSFAGRAGLQYDINRSTSTGFKRDLYFSLGYPDELAVSDYRDRYERGDISERIIEAYPNATWSSGASVVEDPTPDVVTEFEQATLELFERLGVWMRLLRADILAGLGRYSVVLIGAADKEETGLSAELTGLTDQEGVLFLRPLAEDEAKIEQNGLVAEPTDPRYGEPEFYTVNLGGTKDNTKVHWTRIVHVAAGCLGDDIYGKPVLRSVWNRLNDLEKLVGAGAEAAFQRMDPGMHIDVEPEVEFDQVHQDALEDQLDEKQHGLRRNLLTRGAKLAMLSATVQAFGSNVDTVLKIISGAKGIPLRILTGSERGELASGQDRSNWADRIAERRREFAVPLARTFIDRMISVGALPKPKDPYSIVWPDIDELNEAEKAEVAAKLAQANAAQVSAGLGVILTDDEIRESVYDLEPVEESARPEPQAGTTGLRSLARAKARLAANAAPKPAYRVIHKVADLHAPKVASVFLGLWLSASSAIEAEPFASAYANGTTEQYVAGVLATADTEAQETVRDTLLAVVADGGEASARQATAAGGWFRAAAFEASFDATDPRAIDWATAEAAELLTEVSEGTRRGVAELIAKGLREGIPPAQLQALIQDLIGLRSDQVVALENFTAQGKTAKQIARHAKKLLKDRATLIARTETISAANEGQRQAWKQGQASGQIPLDAQRVWIVTNDDRLRDAHADIEGQTRGIDEPFVTGDGVVLMNPSEPNCRCAVGLVRA